MSQAVVIVRELRPGDQRLLAYYTLEHGQDATVSQLRRHLKARLPEYMVPSLLVALDAFPLTENGKIKRGALPDPFGADLSRGSDGFAPPESEMEELLASAWQNALGVERVGREDNFFEIGGHSLLAIQVISVIEDKTGVRLSPRQLGLEGLSSLAASCQSAVGPDMGERETGSKSGGLVSRLVAILRPSRRSTTN